MIFFFNFPIIYYIYKYKYFYLYLIIKSVYYLIKTVLFGKKCLLGEMSGCLIINVMKYVMISIVVLTRLCFNS